MTTEQKQDIAALKALAEAATTGPWEVRANAHPHYLGGFHKELLINTSWYHPQLGRQYPIVANSVGLGTEKNGPLTPLVLIEEKNAAYIAATNPLAVLAMIAHIEQLEAQLAEARKLPVFREACEMKRAGDQSVKIIFSSCRAASQFEKDVRSAGVQRGIESTKGKS
ncbi:hypothetical protein [Glaciimonas immobilis]|uniref:Ead/Ea22-like family protein n=1 Tax=Glaciimonas immobilis TaxID=728004 RepID=A0A840RVX5_9BURK|nr:hypothetical protein [Glaciimonas immobilis]KAF3997499.1 hypothetical protein HAV38_12525 [Glaciimonas immobilis]MBB5200824.1 hypothetical protein [Glaciimonas immobilis]